MYCICLRSSLICKCKCTLWMALKLAACRGFRFPAKWETRLECDLFPVCGGPYTCCHLLFV